MPKPYVYFSEVIDLVESRRTCMGYVLVDRRLLEDMHEKLRAQGLVSGRFEDPSRVIKMEDGHGGEHAKNGFRRYIPIYE